ncbi:MAG: stage II sporulation protein P [Bacilli bacterium]|nr:stage II sporulation protein P [Bacilli bacterium]
MGRRFIARRKKRFTYKYILFFFGLYLIFSLFINFLFPGLSINNETFFNLLLTPMNAPQTTDNKLNLINNFIKMLTNNNLQEPHLILHQSFAYLVDLSKVNDGLISGLAFADDYSDFEDLKKETDYIPDPNPSTVLNPIVYLYNSHQLETYQMTNTEIYNIRPNVMMASYILREHLNKLGVPTMVDETNLTEFMRFNNWSHAHSYQASRFLLKEAMSQQATLKYFIDIHRDSTKKAKSTIVIGDKPYARLLFVVGLEHKNYLPNLTFARTLHTQIEARYPGLSRGVLTKSGPGVNGVYNQDLNSNIMLLEIGGVDNTIDEVTNTTEVMAYILFNYIKGDKK